MGSCTLHLQLEKQLFIQTFKYLDEEPTMILDPFLAILYRPLHTSFRNMNCRTKIKLSPDACILEDPYQNFHVLAADMKL